MNRRKLCRKRFLDQSDSKNFARSLERSKCKNMGWEDMKHKKMSGVQKAIDKKHGSVKQIRRRDLIEGSMEV